MEDQRARPDGDGRTISPRMREWLREVETRWQGHVQCWKCLEFHRELEEVEQRGWLCKECVEKPIR